ncbi:MAG TPA: hypothetical protein VK196_15095 [Magnetospirillum sp.]|nr:hypothetical protein [Magnetospirillum sp.]
MIRPQIHRSPPPDRGAAGVYSRPTHRRWWIAVAVALAVLVGGLSFYWWLT